MKRSSLILAAIACVLVSSCGTARKAQSNQQSDNAVYQQQYQSQREPDEAGFVEIRKSPVEELSYATGTDEIRAYGQAESSNEQLALNAARAQATAALREKIEVYVRSGLDQFMQQTHSGDEFVLDESTRNQIITAAKGVVNGCTILDARKMFNQNTGRYKYEVCVTYNRAGVIGAMQRQSEYILKNEKRFEQDMKSAWDALDAHNSRVTLGEQQQMRQNEMEQSNLDRESRRTNNQ